MYIVVGRRARSRWAAFADCFDLAAAIEARDSLRRYWPYHEFVIPGFPL